MVVVFKWSCFSSGRVSSGRGCSSGRGFASGRGLSSGRVFIMCGVKFMIVRCGYLCVVVCGGYDVSVRVCGLVWSLP